MKYIGLVLVCMLIPVFGIQRQHFRASPQDKEVIEGNVIDIDCEVGNQKGRVQWAKDGFVLGFNRSIPGYPRYEMWGDPDKGEHHLRIYNATLVDDADYQCQVAPSDGHPPIRATGHLTVLMPPTQVSLLAASEKYSKDIIEVNEGGEVTLQCLVEGAKPIAQIRWYKNNEEINLESRVDIQDATTEERKSISSKIDLRFTSADDGSSYTCEAIHPALSKPMRSNVKISVLYPPGPPAITGYSTGETIRAGEERMLTCRSRGGNPLGRVKWYRNNVLLDDSDVALNGESMNQHTFIVAPVDNEAIYTCRVSNKQNEKPLTASVTLDVQFPPEKVVVSGPKHARVGDNVTMTCIATNSNPPTRLSWVVDGQPHLEGIADNERIVARGGWKTTSRLSLLVPSVQRDLMVACHANNQALGNRKVDTYELSVYRPPSPPVIYGYHEGMGIPEGTEKEIRCVSRGGNPPAYLEWYKNGVKVNSQIEHLDDYTEAVVKIRASPSDNGALYKCEAHNSASKTPVTVTANLIVHFAPKTVKIDVRPKRLSSQNQALLTCRAGSSNPPAVIHWLRGGYRLDGRVIGNDLMEFGGKSITNQLAVNLTHEDDGLTYTCVARNMALQKEMTSSVTLEVFYAPVFLDPPGQQVNIEIGDSRVLNLTAKGNPSPVLYKWAVQGYPLSKPLIHDNYRHTEDELSSKPRISADGPLLYLNDIQPEDSGDYELTASNEEGVSIFKLFINVEYPPKVVHTSQEVMVSEGQSAILDCVADGNPLKEDMMDWVRPQYDFSKTIRTFTNKKTSLNITKATKEDIGIFTCVVDNGIGAPASSDVTLIVKHKPVINKSRQKLRAAVEEGGIGVLQCIADGAPTVEFSWRRDGILLNDGSKYRKYSVDTEKVGIVTWASNFSISNVDSKDYAFYECVAENELGVATLAIEFTPPTRPDPPSSLKIINSTHDSVTLSWDPGFDGGSPQSFRLRYHSKNSGNYQYSDVYQQGVTTYTVPNLRLNTEYFFSIMSMNDIGGSEYKGGFVQAKTLSEAPPTPKSFSNRGKDNGVRLPSLWVVLIVLIATALPVLNVSAIVCIVRRRRRKRGVNNSQRMHLHNSNTISLNTTSASGEPICLGVSDQGSSKSTANTMYAPSSYNDTVVGETLSSISEKSRESYAQDDSVEDYERVWNRRPPPRTIYLSNQYAVLAFPIEETHKHASSTYLIDQIEPPPEYASQTPSQPSTTYEPHEDDYADVLRRNAYNHQLGKVTPRPPSRATHYSTSPENRGYITYSYSPSPTGLPNGAAQYHAGVPAVSLGLQHEHLVYPDPVAPDVTAQSHIIQNLGLDNNPPPALVMDQQPMPPDHPSLAMDPHSITIDHQMISVTDLTATTRNGDLRVQPSALSTFNPNPSPSTTFSGSDLEGHLV